MAIGRASRYLTWNQNFISGVILFFTVGIYLAVLGLGAGGGKPSSQKVSDISNCSLYALFGVSGFFSGSVLNKIGPKWTMMLGIFGYPFYVAGLFYYDRTGGEAFPIIGGIVLGFCAALLWSTSGFIQWAYATEAEKGEYISIQYSLNQIGSAIGSLVALVVILNGTNTSDGSPTSVYIIFIVLMCIAFIVAFFGLVAPKQVRRPDDTSIAIFRVLSFKEEILGVSHVLKDWRVIALLPVMFCTEMPLAIIPSINSSYFNLRTRALTPTIYYTMMLPSAYAVRWLTDKSSPNRRTRGIYSVVFVAIFVYGFWIALLAWLYSSEAFANPPTDGVDWTDTHLFVGPFIIFMIYGVLFTIHQLTGMWILGTFSNDPRTMAVYGGLWKGVAALGLTIIFGMSSAEISSQILTCVVAAMQFVSVPIMFILVWKYCLETNYGKEANVIVPHYAEEKFHVHTILADASQNSVLEGREVEEDNAAVEASSKITEKA